MSEPIGFGSMANLRVTWTDKTYLLQYTTAGIGRWNVEVEYLTPKYINTMISTQTETKETSPEHGVVRRELNIIIS